MILYKYCPAKWALRTLEEMRLKVTLPNECNDPFEFTPRSKMLLTRNYMLQKVYNDPEHFRPVYDQLVEDGFSRPFEDFLRSLPDQIKETFPKILRLYKAQLIQNDLASRNEASKVVGVLCFSAKDDNMPMWAHYADNHGGIVIGFNIHDAAFRNGISAKVRYRKHRVAVNPAAVVGTPLWWKQIHHTIFTKSREWSYEQEYRIILRLADTIRGTLEKGRAGYFVDIWGNTVDSVIFGRLIQPKHEKAILREIIASKKLRFSGLRLFRAVQHPKRYALAIESA